MALPSMPDITLSNRTRLLTGGVQVKEEKPEDAEISALAAKMVEANKAKMAVTSSPPLQPRGQGPGILAYFNRRPVGTEPVLSGSTPPAPTNGTTASPSTSPYFDEYNDPDKPPFDLKSQKGKFAWTEMGEKHIPYIFRGEEKYTAVRMVENKLLLKFLSCLNADIYNCTCIRSYYITEDEAKLLTEINTKHCESRFGPGSYSTKDLVVRLKDAEEFYLFLEFCYCKLTNPLTPISTGNQRCGFIRINSESVVPYALTEGKQFVPLFYFDGETDTLKDKAVLLDGWDLAYLKFCCKVQGIRSELFESDTCVCISLDHIKNYFAGGTVFEEYWPPKLLESSLLVAVNQRVDRCRYAVWTKAPPPLPSPPAPAAPKDTTNGWPHSTPAALSSRYYRQQPTLPPQPVRNASVNQMNHLVSSNNLSGRYGAGTVSATATSRLQQQSIVNSHYYPTPTPSHVGRQLAKTYDRLNNLGNSVGSPGQQPPALVRVTAPPATHLPQTASYSTSSIVLQPNNALGLMSSSMMPPPSSVSAYSNSTNNNNNNSTHKNYAPPPLIPVNGTSQSVTCRYYSSGGGTDVIDLSSPPQSPQRGATGLMPNGASKVLQSSVAPRTKRLIQISETTSKQHLNNSPFKMQKALINGKMVPCINAKAYLYSDLLLTVNDLLEHFFPQIPVSKCREVLQDVLNVELFAGNTQQKKVLRENNKIMNLNEEVPLIQLKDVITYMPQLTYVMGRMSPSSLREESQPKRQRVS